MKKYFILLAFLFLTRILFAQDTKPKIFSKKVDFHDQIFTEEDDFGYATFSKVAHFFSGKFIDTARFGSAQFSKEADFEYVQFSKEANFESAKFSDTTFFGQAEFSKDAYFYFAEFSKYAGFGKSHFAGTADFSSAKFLHDADFIAAQFSKGVDFGSAQFSKDVDFGKAIFNAKSILNLSNLSLKDSTNFNFNNTVFPDTILFAGNLNIRSDIFFTNSNFTASSRYDNKKDTYRPILIYLYNTNIAKLHLDYVRFKLLIPDSTFLLGEYEEKRKVISYAEKSSIYEALLNNFKTNGQTEGYKLLDIEYQEFKWQHNTWTRHFARLPKYWWNFGYDKEYIFGWTIVFLFLFTCITYFFIYSLNTAVYPLNKIPVNESWNKKLTFKDFHSRVWCSFIYTSTIFFLFSLKVEKIDFKNKAGTFYLIAVYTIGIVCMAYMVNFVLQKTY
jgi:hypothetical protein